MKNNDIYTYDYSQPEDYRFSLDSVFLAQSVANEYKNLDLKDFRALDVCSGCGVVGLELNFHLKSLNKIDFLEVQEIYRSHFEKNIQQTHSENPEFQLILSNYDILLENSYTERYDLIVSNPPYFFKNEGLLSPNEFKNRCRFFLDSDFKNLINGIYNSLKKEASAYILLRPGTHHGRDLLEETKIILLNKASVELFDEVRGTNVVRIKKF